MRYTQTTILYRECGLHCDRPCKLHKEKPLKADVPMPQYVRTVKDLKGTQRYVVYKQVEASDASR